MTLPKYNESPVFIKKKLLSGKSIGVRGWKVKDEKELLFVLESEENLAEKKTSHLIEFLKKCTDDPQKFDTISENDIKKIAIDVRLLAKGETIEYIQTCPHCKFKFDDAVNIIKDQVSKEFDASPIIVNDRLTITVEDLNWKKVEELFEKYGKTPSTFTFYHLINSIDSVTLDGKTYTEFTPEEVEAIVDELESDDLKKIYEEFDKKLSSCDLERNVRCFKCGKTFDINYGDLLSFLVL